MSEKKPYLTKLLGWSLYDFANTIFSAVVLTLYFPLHLTSLAAAKWPLGAATTISMLLAGFITPFLGAVTDATGRTKRYLIQATVLCVAFNVLLGFSRNVPVLLFYYVIACFFYHISLVFYNALLPVAAPPERQGLASGLGVGLGYLGVVCVLPAMHAIQKAAGMSMVFPADAVLFLAFSLPLFLFVPERSVGEPKKFTAELATEEWRRIGKLVRELPRRPALFLFLAGNFFIVDAVNSTILWFSVFTKEVYNPGQQAIVAVMMALNAAAFIAGVMLGFFTDRIGSMRTLIFSSVCLTMLLVVLTQRISFPVFAAVSIAGGSLSISGVWTAGRKVLLELAPEDSVGEYFGLYGLVTKVSVIGSFVYGMASDAAGMRTGLWTLVVPAAAGLLLLIRCDRVRGKSVRE